MLYTERLKEMDNREDLLRMRVGMKKKGKPRETEGGEEGG